MMHVSMVNFNNHIRYNRLIRFNNESEGQTDRVKSWDLSDLKTETDIGTLPSDSSFCPSSLSLDSYFE